ncbi:MAG TPA: hypothetical protein VGF21_02050 [Thermoleophilaceae bacterium]|jgi:hypothetical protein
MKIPAIIRRTAMTGALALTLFAVSVPAAFAGENETIKVKGGSVAFFHKGDFLVAYDGVRDKLGVRAYLLHGNRATQVTDIAGGAAISDQLSIREGTKVYLIVCYERHGKDVQCSGAQDAVA